MKINSIEQIADRYKVSVTFSNQLKERFFLQKVTTYFQKAKPVNCMITELDTGYSTYEEYFEKDKYYVFDRLTTMSIFAFELNTKEIQEVISNWGYYSIDAMFAFGNIDINIKKAMLDVTDVLKNMPIVISQVLDNSIDIDIERNYFQDILNIFSTN